MEAIGFDLGDTLIYYNNVPLNWNDCYISAFRRIIDGMELSSRNELIDIGCRVLSKYNTRVYPRDHEVRDIDIFCEIHKAWGISDQGVDQTIRDFFSYFQQGSIPYEDTLSTMRFLKHSGIKIGILTDVPYGMNRELVLRDITPFREYIDFIITSVDVGFRKPCVEGYLQLAKELGCPPNEMYYVGNEKKDIDGANSIGIKSILVNRIEAKLEWGQNETIRNLSEIKRFCKK